MESSAPSGEAVSPGVSIVMVAWMFAGFLAICLSVYRGALEGPFISDDGLYLVNNPYVRSFGLSAAIEMFDPTTDATLGTANYAPIHQLGHAFAWQAFGDAVPGHHVVNIALHAGNAVLLTLLLGAAGLPRGISLAAAALFVLHPANVEAVAWISQLKSVLALSFALSALLAFRRNPVASALLFALALLSKASAGFALPMAAAWTWAWRGRSELHGKHTLGLGVWALVFALYAIPQYVAFAQVGGAYANPYPDIWAHLRTIFSIGARYIAMAASGYGVSGFHEPAPVAAIFDPWWLAGVALAVGLLWRIGITLRGRREEAGWWLGALAAFAPVSQVIPFYYGMADRYLYFILPGLIGGALLFGEQLQGRLGTRLPRAARWLALAVVALLAVRFAGHAQGRTALWMSRDRLMVDAAGQYPNGAVASYVGSVLALQAGDREKALVLLRASADRGFHFMHSFQMDAHFEPLHDDPRFHALLHDLAGRQIEFTRKQGVTNDSRLRGVAAAHVFRGEFDEAIEVLEGAIRNRGPLRSELLQDLALVSKQRAASRAAAAATERESASP